MMNDYKIVQSREGYAERSLHSLIGTLSKLTDGFEKIGQSTLMGWVDSFDEQGRKVTTDPNYMEGHFIMDGTDFAVLKKGWKVYIFDSGENVRYTHMLYKDLFDELKKRHMIVELDFEPDYAKEYWNRQRDKENGEFINYANRVIGRLTDDRLHELYKITCEEYRRRINDMWGLDIKDSWWPGDDVGSTLILSDCEFSLSMSDVVLLVNLDVSYDDFTDWWYYTLEENNENVNAYSWFKMGYRPDNYKTWKKETEEQLRKIRENGEQQRKEDIDTQTR